MHVTILQDPGASCARCQSDSSRIVSDIAHEADCRSTVPQVVKGMVEQERMQKHIGDAPGQDRQYCGCTSGNVTPSTDHPDSSEDCGGSTNAIP